MTLDETLEGVGLTVESAFVPFSQSRNAKQGAKPDERSLNWKVTLKKDGRDILATDYQAGIGHCPSYLQGMRWTLENAAKIEHETEKGTKAGRFVYGRGIVLPAKGKILPDTKDVIHSLVTDSDVLNYSTFEDWADCFGYDTDSRSAEKTYKACLELGLSMRNGLGESTLEELREAFQDY